MGFVASKPKMGDARSDGVKMPPRGAMATPCASARSAVLDLPLPFMRAAADRARRGRAFNIRRIAAAARRWRFLGKGIPIWCSRGIYKP